MRRKSIDLARGILIMLVIAGHILLGGPGTFAHYLIYSFHMPLFIALSGYVLNWTALSSLSLPQLGKKYWHRLILPWLIAVFVYQVVNDPSLLTHPWRLPSAIGMGIIKPFFHLWFIPAYLGWVLLSWLLLKIRLSIRSIFIVSLVLSIAGLWVKGPEYYLFFALGGLLKTTPRKPPLSMIIPLCLLLLTGNTLLFYYPLPQLSYPFFIMLDTALTFLMVGLIEREIRPVGRLLEWTGENSLGIYLWHVLPILLIFRWHDNPVIFYCMTIALEIALFAVIFLTGKNSSLRRYLYGRP